LTDFVPVWGSRRKSYLIFTSIATALVLGVLALWPPRRGQAGLLLGLLILPTAAVAFADVVADALMVEKGQPRGLTGRLQSVQWAAIYAATILTGALGGYLSEHHVEHVGFAICAGLAVGMLALSAFCVREESDGSRPTSREALYRLSSLVRSRELMGVGAFL